MDQRVGSLSCKSKSNRWTWVVLCYLLDTARVNAQTLWALIQGIDPRNLDSFEFGCEMARLLVWIFMRNRPLDGLQSSILKKRAMFLGLPMPGEKPDEPSPSMTAHPKVGDRKWFCHVCYAQLPHVDRQKAKVVKKCL